MSTKNTATILGKKWRFCFTDASGSGRKCRADEREPNKAFPNCLKKLGADSKANLFSVCFLIKIGIDY